jgi:hypothetical protein
MAKKMTVEVLDDLDESPADDTVAFSLDGQSYEIDLNQKHADELRESLARYIGAARKTGRPGSGSGGGQRRSGRSAGASRPTPAGSDRERVQAIREWARSNGHTVSERGRLSSKVIAAYDEAH